MISSSDPYLLLSDPMQIIKHPADLFLIAKTEQINIAVAVK